MVILNSKLAEKKKRKHQFSVRLNEDSFRFIRQVQDELGWSQSDVIEFALEQFSTHYSKNGKHGKTYGELDADRVKH